MGLFKRRPRDPDEVVREKVAILWQEHERNTIEETGLLNRPRYGKTISELERMGSDAVPTLCKLLDQPRRPTLTAEGENDFKAQLDQGVANDIAEVLGAIGDPRAVSTLREQLSSSLSAPPRALASFPEGLECLLEAVGDSDEGIRAQVASGLGFPHGNQDRVASALATLLGDESSWVRRSAAGSAINLEYPTHALHEALSTVVNTDPNDGIRNMADRALREVWGQPSIL